MSTYYVRDGILYTTKTLCNLKITWQKECIVYPDEAQRIAKRNGRFTAAYHPVFPNLWNSREAEQHAAWEETGRHEAATWKANEGIVDRQWSEYLKLRQRDGRLATSLIDWAAM